MKIKLTAILLCIIIAISAIACASEGAPQAETETPQSETQAPPQIGTDTPVAGPDGFVCVNHWDIPDDVYIATLGDNGVSVTSYAYFFMLYRNYWSHSAMMMGFDPATFWDIEEDGATIRQMLLEEAMRVSKEYSALYNLAVAAGATESAQEGEAADEQIATLLEQQFAGNAHAFQHSFLVNPTQMREVLRRINVAARHLNTEMEAITVTEADIQAVRESMPPGFEQVTVRHILISRDDAMSEAEQQAAAELAESILERINAGEDIGALAAQYSDDPGSRYTNGEYTFGRGDMVPEFEQWSFESQIGDTGIVRTMFGYHIMQKMSGVAEMLERQARSNIFEQNHYWLYDMLESDQWVVNQELLDRFAEML